MAVVRELIADAGRRSCLRAITKDGSTVVHIASAAGQAAVVQLLLDAGARADGRDRVRQGGGVGRGSRAQGAARYPGMAP
jgi:ankyrin repeat protein